MPVTMKVNLPDPAVDTLQKLAEKRNTTATEVIRYAISLARQLDDEASRGGKILIMKQNGNMDRMVV